MLAVLQSSSRREPWACLLLGWSPEPPPTWWCWMPTSPWWVCCAEGVGRRAPKRSTMITRHRLLKMPPMFQVIPPPHM
jgi:hypothetical protein